MKNAQVRAGILKAFPSSREIGWAEEGRRSRLHLDFISWQGLQDAAQRFPMTIAGVLVILEPNSLPGHPQAGVCMWETRRG